MKALLLIICTCLLGTITVSAQQALQGRVVDAAGQDLPYINVALLALPDSSLAGGTVTTESGTFLLPAPEEGSYVLRFSAIGYQELFSDSFIVSGPSFQQDFGSIRMEEKTAKLKEVTVEALRPTIIQQADRMVVSVEGTALAAGSTAFDVLADAPGVFIDQDGRIQLNGKAGVTIMLDGRLTYLSAADLKSMLEGMPAENIKSIEIITHPSARFDAEGASGILNIQLKEHKGQGVNGSLYTTYAYNQLHTFAGGGNVFYRTGPLNLFVHLDMAQRPSLRKGVFSRLFVEEQEKTFLEQQIREDKISRTPSLRVGGDYRIREGHQLGLVANIVRQQDTAAFLTETYIGPVSGTPVVFIEADNLTAGRFSNYNTHLYYSGEFDSLGTAIHLGMSYVNILNRESGYFHSFYRELLPPAEEGSELLLSDNPNGYDIYAAKLDFIRPFSRGLKVETGLKASRVISDNDLRFYIHEEGLAVPDPRRSNHFIYKENIYAAYLNLSGPLGSRLSVQAGVRAEDTHSFGVSKTTGQRTKKDFLQLFPSLFIEHKVNKQYQLNYHYSRRIQRPDYEQLNPFIFYLDPFTWSQGNPYLRPQYTHSFGVTQTFKEVYRLVVGYQLSHDFLTELPFMDAAAQTTTFMDYNVEEAHYLSATAVVPVKLFSFWDSQNTAVAAYQEYRTPLPKEEMINQETFYYFQSTHTILLPFALRMEISAAYRGPSIWGVERVEPYGWINAGLKKSLLEDKLEINLGAGDLFRSRLIKGGASIGESLNLFDQYFFSRKFSISLRYNFRKGIDFKAPELQHELEELDRAGN
ncbi:outer membrane beta-barrel family protein [Nafulsella turpanensis]|uniref:outer membrane beta-barrel family protein n=1 Tax=Nafulsella turpanensis TaxID=1265690 RepID=UPI0003774768|nr:outer membrane beta-barrel family protein [Nafulsella turpanensis]